MTDSALTDLSLPADTQALLDRYGFSRDTFEALRARLLAGQSGDEQNRIRGRVEAPGPHEVYALPALGSAARARLTALGNDAIRQGRVAAVVLAGGMATRFGGVVKAAVEVARGKTFLDLKLADIRACARRAQGRVPTYLMTSFATDAEVRRMAESASTPEMPVGTFAQFISLRLTPEGGLFRDGKGHVSPYAPGHGDLSFALARSGVLAKLRESGVSLIYMSNVDNLAATLEPAVVGAHLENQRAISVEVADKAKGDKGGAPARVDGVLQIVEGFRFPKDFDQDSIPVFNTNTFVIDLAAIDRSFDLSWFAVTKEVDGKKAIQFERLVGELTAFLPTAAVGVAREGEDGRFMPVKDPPELEARRPAIVQLLEKRGAL
ncbi:MAG TPA: UTP--glucose-1-phosphate uridylyltransferase [Polyangiales bacterium]